MWRRLYEVALSLQYLHERGLACAHLNLDSVFCAQLEDKAVLRGVGLIPLGDNASWYENGVSTDGDADQDHKTGPHLVALNMFELGVVILHTLVPPTKSKERAPGLDGGESKSSRSEHDQFHEIPMECPPHIREAEWRILEQLRDFNAESSGARLKIIHDMQELGDFDQRRWMSSQWLDVSFDRASGVVDVGRIVVPRLGKSVAQILSECSEMSVSDHLAHRVHLRLANVFAQVREVSTQQKSNLFAFQRGDRTFRGLIGSAL